MSWLNNSLNTIKGQLTNLAQEVLADTAGPGDDDYRGPDLNTKTAVELLTETQMLKEQLEKSCEDKDREVSTRRNCHSSIGCSACCCDSGFNAVHLLHCIAVSICCSCHCCSIEAAEAALVGLPVDGSCALLPALYALQHMCTQRLTFCHLHQQIATLRKQLATLKTSQQINEPGVGADVDGATTKSLVSRVNSCKTL